MTNLLLSVLGVSGAAVVAVVTATWHLSAKLSQQAQRLARVEQQLADLPATLNGTVIRPHEDRCKGYRS